MSCGRWTILLASAAMVATLTGCGGADAAASSPAEEVEEHLAGTDAGDIDLQLTATGAGTSRAGFGIVGRYSYRSPGRYPILDLTYRRAVGGAADEMRVLSTGRAVYVARSGRARQLTTAEVAPLRLGDGNDGFDDLGIAGWVRQERVHRGPDGTEVIRGRLDVADFLADLARLAAQAGAGRDLRAPDEESARRLRRLVDDSAIEIVASRRTHQLRSLNARLDFETTAGDRLRAALGEYGAASLELRLTFRPLRGDLVVDPPR